jgi:hypothetical protein
VNPARLTLAPIRLQLPGAYEWMLFAGILFTRREGHDCRDCQNHHQGCKSSSKSQVHIRTSRHSVGSVSPAHRVRHFFRGSSIIALRPVSRAASRTGTPTHAHPTPSPASAAW